MPSLKRHCNHITERSYQVESTDNAQDNGINFSITSKLVAITIRANGENTDDALANLVTILRDMLDSLDIDVEALTY